MSLIAAIPPWEVGKFGSCVHHLCSGIVQKDRLVRPRNTVPLWREGKTMKVSFVVMAYKQEQFIERAVASAFAQDYSDLEIVLTDDCSPDSTFEIMSRMAAHYKGPHKVVLNRNPRNLGLIGHVNSLFSLVTSDWLIYNAGDDISEPSRSRIIAQTSLRENPYYIYSNATDIDPAGAPLRTQKNRTRPSVLNEKPLPELARAMSHALGASSAWHRDIFSRFGPISETNLFEDQVLMFRARLLGKVSYIEERLLQYRRSIGLSFQTKGDEKQRFLRDIAILSQRRRDALAVAPERTDIISSIDHKLRKRQLALRETGANRG